MWGVRLFASQFSSQLAAFSILLGAHARAGGDSVAKSARFQMLIDSAILANGQNKDTNCMMGPA